MLNQREPIEFVDVVDEGADAELTPEQISQAVLYSTDWTAETIITQLQHANIDFNLRFQRRDAWDLGKKSRFIESLILGLPVPQIVLAERMDEKGKFIVIDGKQRLLSLLQFRGIAEGKNNAFPLTGLNIRLDLSGKTFDELQKEASHQQDLRQFYNSSIRSVVIRNWGKYDLLHLIFVRLNTGSVRLSPQELRQAEFPGPFSDFIDDAACGSQALKTILRIEQPDFRMRDVELLVRYIAFALDLSNYRGNLKKFLDNTCKRLNKEWIKEKECLGILVKEFEEAIETGIEIFGEDNVSRKYTGNNFEARINRAVLDVIAFYFSNDKIRKAARKHKVDILESFKKLCVESDQFRNSIETTTKSLTATGTRLNLWGKALQKILRIKFNIPEFNNGKIVFSKL